MRQVLHALMAIRAIEHAPVHRVLVLLVADIQADSFPVLVFREGGIVVARQAIGVAELLEGILGCFRPLRQPGQQCQAERELSDALHGDDLRLLPPPWYLAPPETRFPSPVTRPCDPGLPLLCADPCT